MADYHPLLIDKRIVERNIHKGLISRKDFDKYLSELPDSGENAETIAVESPDDSGEGPEET